MRNIEPITNPSFLGNAVLAVPPEPFLKLQDSKNTTSAVVSNTLKFDSVLNLPENLKATMLKTSFLVDGTSNQSDPETLLLIQRIPRSSQIRCSIVQSDLKSEKSAI